MATTSFGCYLPLFNNMVNKSLVLLSSISWAAGAPSYTYCWPPWRRLTFYFLNTSFFFFIRLSSPLNSSDHNLISVFRPVASMPSSDPSKRRYFLHYVSAKWEGLRLYYVLWFPMKWLLVLCHRLICLYSTYYNGGDCLWHGGVH